MTLQNHIFRASPHRPFYSSPRPKTSVLWAMEKSGVVFCGLEHGKCKCTFYLEGFFFGKVYTSIDLMSCDGPVASSRGTTVFINGLPPEPMKEQESRYRWVATSATTSLSATPPQQRKYITWKIGCREVLFTH